MKNTLKSMALFSAICLAFGAFGTAIPGWEAAMRDGRPYVPPKETRSSSTMDAAAMKNGLDSAEAIRAAAKKALGAALPASAEFANVFRTDEESIDTADFVSAGGVRNRIAVYGWLGNFAPYYLTVEGLAANGPSDMAAFLKRNCGVDAKSSAFAVDGVLSAEEIEIRDHRDTLPAPYARFYFAFVDDKPGANWGHPCRCVFISEDCTSFTVLYRQWRPRLISKAGEIISLQPLGDSSKSKTKSLNQIKANVYNYAKGLAAQNSIAYTRGDKSKSYFVLISGGGSPVENGIRFWSDTAMLYSTLRLKYGVPKSNIKLLVSDGTSTEADANLDDAENIVLVDSPWDMDGDGESDITGPATKSAVSSAFASLRSSLTANDQLFVFISSHGGTDGTPGSSNWECYAMLFDPSGYNMEWVDDNELADMTSGFPCPVGFAIETCFSGGFIDDIIATSKRAIATACHHYENSHGFTGGGAWLDGLPGKIGACNCWAGPLISAFRGYIPMAYGSGGYPWADDATFGEISGDADGNGVVSLYEAFSFAVANDHAEEHPQYRTSSGGEPFHLIKQTSSSPSPFPTALDAPSLTFTTGGSSGWVVQSSVVQYGSSALQSSGHASGSSSWIQTTVNGPGTISFYWKVSSEADYDFLKFFIDNVEKGSISGTGDASWRQVSMTVTGSGAHTLKWVYEKDSSGNSGDDCGWIDHVTWTSSSAPAAPDTFGGARTTAGTTSSSGSTTFSNAGATSENGEPLRKFVSTATTTVWFKWAAQTTGDATFTTAGTGFDTVMGVYTGSSVGSLTAVAENDNISNSDYTSRCTFRAERGVSYFVCVSGKNGATGTIKLNWTCSPATPPNGPLYDDFGAARTSAGNTGTSGLATGTNVGATPQNGEPLRNTWAGAKTTVWLKWSARTTADMTFTTSGTGFDTVMGVYTGSSVGGLTKVAENDNASSSVRISSCTFRATQGTTYFVCVSGKNGATGTVRLGWSAAATPPNGPLYDDFGAARTSAGNAGASGTVNGTNVGATPQNGEPLRNYVASATTTVWLKWSAQTTGSTTFTTAGTGFDTVMGVYTGSSVGGLTKIAENDDASGSVRTSSCTFNATRGTSYFVCVGGKNGATGAVKVNWTASTTPNGPLYDDFGAARTTAGNTAASGSVTGTNAGATPQNGEPLRTFCPTATATVWFKWSAAAAGDVTFTTAGTGFDTVMGVYTGSSVGGLTTIAENDDVSGTDRTSACSFTAVRGTSYFICVGGLNGVTGTIKLNWSKPSAPNGPLYDDFGAARTSAGTAATSGSVTGTNVGATLQNGEPIRNYDPDTTHTVWFKWSAKSDCRMRFMAETEVYTSMGVYTGTSVGSLTRVRATHLDRCTIDVTGGTTYYICIGSADERIGPITLSWEKPVPNGPLYDDFGAARTSTGSSDAAGTVTGTNINATPQNGEPLRSAYSTATATVWFKWIAPSTGNMEFFTAGSEFDTIMGVYTGTSVGSLTEITTNDDVSGSDRTSSCKFSAVKGTTYFICVGGYNGTMGSIKLNWSGY